MNSSSAILWRHLPVACNNFFEAGVSGNMPVISILDYHLFSSFRKLKAMTPVTPSSEAEKSREQSQKEELIRWAKFRDRSKLDMEDKSSVCASFSSAFVALLELPDARKCALFQA
jgi:hypothetical protein